jgi:hypothetical protein
MQTVDMQEEDNKGNKFQELVNKLREKFEDARRRKFTFLLIGRTGVGKSSTVNTLMGQEVAQVGEWEPTTFSVQTFEAEVFGIRFEVIDTPGLCDDLEEEGNDGHYLGLVQEKVREIDCMWLVSKLNETRVTGDEKRGIKLISEAFGQGIWEHSIIVFTFACSVSPEKYSEALSKRTDLIRKEIAKYAGEALAMNIPSVAVDNVSPTTPDGEEWLGELYTQVFTRISNQGVTSFLAATAQRVNLSDAKKVGFSPKLEAQLNQKDELDDDNSKTTESNSQTINLNERQAKQVQKRIDASIIVGLGATGASIGAVFGPAGAAIGGGIGAAIGLIAWMWD